MIGFEFMNSCVTEWMWRCQAISALSGVPSVTGGTGAVAAPFPTLHACAITPSRLATTGQRAATRERSVAGAWKFIGHWDFGIGDFRTHCLTAPREDMESPPVTEYLDGSFHFLDFLSGTLYDPALPPG
jgi:hypothetical protein